MSGWILEGAFIYKLNANGHNEWSMQVQPGRDDDDVRTHQYTLESVATMAHAAPDMYEALNALLDATEFAAADARGASRHNDADKIQAAREIAFSALAEARGESPQSTEPETSE